MRCAVIKDGIVVNIIIVKDQREANERGISLKDDSPYGIGDIYNGKRFIYNKPVKITWDQMSILQRFKSLVLS